MDISAFPRCQKCKEGDLVPLSDFGSQGAAIHFKAWACTNPACGFNIKIRNGDLYIDEPIASGALHSPRALTRRRFGRPRRMRHGGVNRRAVSACRHPISWRALQR